jgi:murein L,D-transpeptidase YafK
MAKNNMEEFLSPRVASLFVLIQRRLKMNDKHLYFNLTNEIIQEVNKKQMENDKVIANLVRKNEELLELLGESEKKLKRLQRLHKNLN